jgi:hypothetical protein
MFGMVGALLLAGGVVSAQFEPQLAGSWVLDRSQSQFPSRPGKDRSPDAQAQPADATLAIEQDGNVVKTTRTMARGNRRGSLSETYIADGTERSEPGRRGTVVTRAAYDGDRLVVNQKHTMQGKEGEHTISRESTWTVSPDGKTLRIETTMQGPRGDQKIMAVYTRG